MSKRFKAEVTVNEYDEDFGIFDSEGNQVSEGVTISATGDTALDAWMSLMAKHTVGAWFDKVIPEVGGYDHAHYFRKFFTADITMFVMGKVDEAVEENPFLEHIEREDDGCFVFNYSGNQDIDVSIREYDPDAEPEVDESIKKYIVIDAIDKEDFRKQKQHFVEVLMSGQLTKEQQGSFDGLVCILDAISDSIDDE